VGKNKPMINDNSGFSAKMALLSHISEFLETPKTTEIVPNQMIHSTQSVNKKHK